MRILGLLIGGTGLGLGWALAGDPSPGPSSALPERFSTPASAQDGPPATGGSLRVGVVNLNECFKPERYDWVKQLTDELNKFGDEHTADVEATRKKREEVLDKLRLAQKGSVLYFELVRRKSVLDAELDSIDKVGRLKLANLRADMMTKVFNEILRVSSIVGKDRGFDLILRVEEPQMEEEESLRSVIAQIVERTVLYHTASIDITDAVIDKLNEEFQKKKATTGNDTPSTDKLYHCAVCNLDSKDPRCVRCGKVLEPKQ